jgi:hypothetical protein
MAMPFQSFEADWCRFLETIIHYDPAGAFDLLIHLIRLPICEISKPSN